MARLTYEDHHWSRDDDSAAALERYLALGERPFNKTKQRLLLSLAGDLRGKRVLDYGGGAGYMAIPMAAAGAEVTIVDAEANGLKTARYYAEREQLGDRVRTIQSLNVPEQLKGQGFDLVMAKDIVEHIEDDEGFLKDLSACQKTGGRIVLSTQSSLSLTYLIESTYNKYRVGNPDWCGWDPTHLRFYTPKSLRRKLGAAGYRARRWAGVYIIPYDIIQWATLLKLRVELSWLRHFDLTIGRVFPFNRAGWNVVVGAEKVR